MRRGYSGEQFRMYIYTVRSTVGPYVCMSLFTRELKKHSSDRLQIFCGHLCDSYSTWVCIWVLWLCRFLVWYILLYCTFTLIPPFLLLAASHFLCKWPLCDWLIHIYGAVSCLDEILTFVFMCCAQFICAKFYQVVLWMIFIWSTYLTDVGQWSFVDVCLLLELLN